MKVNESIIWNEIESIIRNMLYHILNICNTKIQNVNLMNNLDYILIVPSIVNMYI